ncbi:MAG TPA: hypothetical protein VKQ32_28915 [Polyangia bacterium]|nr:hypothetical protein [Polyangia bacterium]
MAPFAPTARPTAWAIATLAAAAGATACTGKTLALGDRDPRPYHFEVPQIVTELRSDSRTDNPTLTADLLEIFFTSDRPGGSGGGDVWSARRSDLLHPFSPPTAVTEVNTSTFETSSAISADGLTLWFGSDRPGGVGSTDIWAASRPTRSAAWMTPINVDALNTAVEDIPRPPGQHNLVMPLSSKTATAAVYQTFFAARASAGAPFGTPVLLSALAQPDKSTVDGFLTDDGLTLFYSSAPAVAPADATVNDAGMPTADLFVAFRRSVDEVLWLVQPLDDLNTPGDERDPFLTPDGKTLYFTSDRDGALNIYTASVKPR